VADLSDQGFFAEVKVVMYSYDVRIENDGEKYDSEKGVSYDEADAVDGSDYPLGLFSNHCSNIEEDLAAFADHDHL
tara:strand:- start:408 stop:635 length:228 start_codon:yes stop_codon:yes gene_type:complete